VAGEAVPVCVSGCVCGFVVLVNASGRTIIIVSFEKESDKETRRQFFTCSFALSCSK